MWEGTQLNCFAKLTYESTTLRGSNVCVRYANSSISNIYVHITLPATGARSFGFPVKLSLRFSVFLIGVRECFPFIQKVWNFYLFIKFTNSQNLRLFFYFVGNLLIKSSLDLYQKYRVCFTVHKISRCVPKSL